MSLSFFEHARSVPERRALVYGDRVLTFGELGEASHRIARALHTLGLEPGDTVAVMMENRPEYVELFAAAAESGWYFVGLNWHLTPDELGYILTDSAATCLVSSVSHAAAAVAAAGVAGLGADMVLCLGEAPGTRDLVALATAQAPTPPDVRAAGQVMFYTSGTTGRPKGVRKKLPPVGPGDIRLSSPIGVSAPPGDPPLSDAVHLVGAPLYHAAPIAAVTMPLDLGATVVLMERWTPEGFLDLVGRHRVTTASMVPTMFHRLLAVEAPVRAAADVSSLELITHAGAPCPVEVKRKMIEWVGPILFESYSATEGAGTSINSEEWLAKPGSVGRPSQGVTVKILDEDGRECPIGAEGQVFLSQTLWEFEYLHDPEKTAASRRDGLFTVGDIGYLDEDGYLFLCDRVAEIIVSGGVNIYPAEVEAVLLDHEAVADAAVIGVPNEEWGEEVRALVELRRPGGDEAALEAALIAHCRERLAHYKCPLAIDFKDSLERDPNGKLRKRVLRAPYWAGRDRRI